jgi:hypothetical protein
MPRNKTKAEKAKSAYRLSDFRIKESERAEVKDQKNFGYLDSSYVIKDLRKTVLVSLLMFGLIFVAKQYLG